MFRLAGYSIAAAQLSSLLLSYNPENIHVPDTTHNEEMATDGHDSPLPADTTIVHSPKRTTCYKSLIVVIYTTTLLTGVVIVGISAVTKVVPNRYLNNLIFEDVVPELKYVVVCMLGIGGTLVALSLFGCYGAYNEVSWMILWTCGLVPLVMIGEISIAGLTFYLEGKASGWLDQNIDCLVCSEAVDHAFRYIVTPAILLLICVALQLAVVLTTCKLLQFIEKKEGKVRIPSPREPRVSVQHRPDVSATPDVSILDITETPFGRSDSATSTFKVRMPRWKRRGSSRRDLDAIAARDSEPYAIAYRSRNDVTADLNRTDEHKSADEPEGEPQETRVSGARASARSLRDSIKNFARTSIWNRTRTIRRGARPTESPEAAAEVELDELEAPTGTFPRAYASRPADYEQPTPCSSSTEALQSTSCPPTPSAEPGPSSKTGAKSRSRRSSRKRAPPVVAVAAVAPPVVDVAATTPPVASGFV